MIAINSELILKTGLL